MARPRVTFACELGPPRLTALVADGSVVHDLQALGARVALMLPDFSPERAAVVRTLNAAGIPVVGIPLMPYEDGYYFTMSNAPRAGARYDAWKAWTTQHGLVWDGVGLDIEPEARFYERIMRNPWGLVPMLLPRLFAGRRLRKTRAIYTALIEHIRADGYRVETISSPLACERHAGSTLLQRLLGLVNVTTDREVWMVYSSVMPAIGPGLLWSYGQEAKALAIGTTGGGPDVPSHPQIPALSWDDLVRNLPWRRAGLTTRTFTAWKALCLEQLLAPAARVRLAARRCATREGGSRHGLSSCAPTSPLGNRSPMARPRCASRFSVARDLLAPNNVKPPTWRESESAPSRERGIPASDLSPNSPHAIDGGTAPGR
jgi:hypothetical protein